MPGHDGDERDRGAGGGARPAVRRRDHGSHHARAWGLWLWEQALEVRPELRGRFMLISAEARPGQQAMGLFLQSEHFLVKPFSLDGLLDQAEEIGRGGGDGHGVLPKMPEQVQPGLEDDEQGEREER